MSALLSGEPYKEFLNGKKMSELKNMITTVVKHVRFTLTGKKKAELIDHLMEHTRYDTKANSVILMGKLDTVPLPASGVRDTSKTAAGKPRKVRADKGIMKIKEAKNLKVEVVAMPKKKAEAPKVKTIDMPPKKDMSVVVPRVKKRLIRKTNKPVPINLSVSETMMRELTKPK
jgi:hypothetical protein